MAPARTGGQVPSTKASPRGADDGHRLALVLGASAWLVQPLYVVAELVAAARSSAPYSLLDQTISDLGATTCTSIDYPYGAVEVCSPLHALVNGSFIVFGLLLAVGAVLLRRFLPRPRLAAASTVAWVVAGLSSVATGFVPVDRDLDLHSVAALPSLFAMPIALLLLAGCLRRMAPGLGTATAVVGLASLAGSVVFLVTATSPELGGVWERLGFWPSYLWLPVVALVLLRRARASRG
ncbi:DUF998 domain-containing protein [Georgenia faecalis]|uniref:DUF998 domain-containing protein n=1 Tax=Georgenia faecalis TaxID=2483799 RepID=A0ABV9DCM5_9MICO|nr:DUF998 domain-containing protein [Georgenia faecalis]